MEIQKKIRSSRVRSKATNREIQRSDLNRPDVTLGLDSSTHPSAGGFARNDRVLLVLFLSVFFSGVSWAAMVPPWQTPDEQAHFAQAQDYAAVGYRPNPGASTSQDIVISEKLLGTFRDERGNNKFTYHPEYRLPYSNSTVGFNEEEIAGLPLQMRKVFLINEATGYPPLYYWYIALINKIMWGQDLIIRVFGSRLATVLISAAGVWAVYGLAKEVFSSRPAALAAAGLWGLAPMRQFAASGVTSDALMNSVYPLALLCLVKLTSAPSRRIFWLTVIAVGAAMAVKLQSVFLLPMLVLVLINLLKKSLRATPMSHRGSVVTLLKRPERIFAYAIIGVLGFGFLVMIMGHIRPLANRFPRLLGYLFLPEIANFSDLYSRPAVAEYIGATAAELYRQVFPWYFGVYRWLSLTLPIWVYRIIKVILLVSAAGWGFGLLKKQNGVIRWRQTGLVALSALIYAGGLLGWNFFYWKSHGFSLGIQGRYFFPNMAEHMILLMGGLILTGRLISSVIPAKAGIYLNRFLVKPGMTRGFRVKPGMTVEKVLIFAIVLGMVIFNWYSWWFVASSYFDNTNFYTFFLQASQYKPWFFKWPFLPGVIGLGLISSGWFLWEFGVECFREEGKRKKEEGEN